MVIYFYLEWPVSSNETNDNERWEADFLAEMDETKQLSMELSSILVETNVFKSFL